MKRQRFKFKLLAFFLFALFALLGAYGMHSIALYGNRWFTYAKKIRVYGRRSRTSCREIFSTAAAWCWRPLPSARTALSPAFISRMKLPAAPLCTCWAIPTGRLPTGLKVFQTAYLYGFQTGIWGADSGACDRTEASRRQRNLDRGQFPLHDDSAILPAACAR